jgi:heme/copper-type cytochrome/quinol oxidase subunit 3
MSELTVDRAMALPVGPLGRHGTGWWGVGTLIVSEAALFVFLLFSYFYSAATAHTGWLLEPTPSLTRALPATLLLLASSVVVWVGEQGVLRRRRAQALMSFGLALAMGIVFVYLQWLEWQAKSYGIGASSYASLYYLTTGMHIAHVLVGLVVLAAVFTWTALDYFGPQRYMAVSAGVLYWHFVNVVSVLVFATFYVTPYLGFGR